MKKSIGSMLERYFSNDFLNSSKNMNKSVDDIAYHCNMLDLKMILLRSFFEFINKDEEVNW